MEQKESESNTAAEASETAVAEKKSSTVEDNIWLRGLLMALYVVALRVVEFIAIALLVLQFFSKLITKKPHQKLTDFGESLSQYAASIIRYQTFNSDARPYPLGDWPKVDRSETAVKGNDDGVPPTQAQAS